MGLEDGWSGRESGYHHTCLLPSIGPERKVRYRPNWGILRRRVAMLVGGVLILVFGLNVGWVAVHENSVFNFWDALVYMLLWAGNMTMYWWDE
jgi:hypothetical protein